MTAATLTDWAAAGSLGLSAIGLIALAMAFADADPACFDPRPAIGRLVESGRLDWLLIAVADARHSTRTGTRRAAVTVAALLMLLSAPTAEVTK